MKPVWVMIVVIAATVVIRAQHAAPMLIEARKVFLADEPGSDAARWQGELRRELSRWARWTEVPTRDAADVVVSIGAIHGESGSRLTVAVRAAATATVLWVSSGRSAAAALKPLEAQLSSSDQLRAAAAFDTSPMRARGN